MTGWRSAALVFVCVSALTTCSPELNQRRCESEVDCLIGERCVASLCLPMATADGRDDPTDTGDLDADEDSGDFRADDADGEAGDGPTDAEDTDLRDAPEDGGDVPDDGGDVPDEGDTADQADARDVDSGEPDGEIGDVQDLDDVGDASDAHDLPDTSDAGDAADRTDGDASDGADETDGAGDCTLFPSSAPLTLYQPCLQDQRATEPRCAQKPPMLGCSARELENQLIEVPLVNGINNHDVVGYFSFDLEAVGENTGVGDTEVDYQIVAGNGAELTFASTGPGVVGGGSLSFGPSNTAKIDGGILSSAQEWTIATWLVACPEEAEPGCGDDNHQQFAVRTAAADALVVRFQGTTTLAIDLEDSDGSATGRVPLDALSLGAPFHLAVVRYLDEPPMVYFDGLPQVVSWTGSPAGVGRWESMLGVDIGSDSSWQVELDELLFVTRALTGYELRSLVDSFRPFGTTLLAGAQSDFSDVRVTDASSHEAGAESVAAFELVGPRRRQPGRVEPGGCAMGFEPDPEDPDLAITNCADESTQLATHPGVASVTGRFGVSQSAVSIIADDAQLDVGSTDALFGSDQVTVNLWYRLFEPGVLVAANGTPVLEMTGDKILALNGTLVSPSLPMNPAAWHHVALVQLAEDRYRLFFDGIQVAACSDCSETLPSESVDDGDTVVIGGNVNEVRAYVDELLIIPTAMTRWEVAAANYPPLPSVRFLGRTHDTDSVACTEENHEFLAYSLAWGNDAAAALPEFGRESGRVMAEVGDVHGWWLLDEGVGPVVHDRSPTATHLERIGTTQWGTGPDGPGIDFNAGRLDALTTPDLNLASSRVQIDAVVEFFEVTSEQVLFTLEDGGVSTLDYSLLTEGTPRLTFTTLDGETPLTHIEVANPGVTVDAGTNSMGVHHQLGGTTPPTFYLGVISSQKSSTVTAPLASSQADTWSLGSRGNGIHPVSGRLDSMRFMSAAGDLALERTLNVPAPRSYVWRVESESGVCVIE